MQPLTVLDLFSGACGGWSLGLHRTGGFETVAACEIDPWRREQYAKNFPNVRMYADVRELSADRLRADGLVPDVIVGSPPCQDASAANHKGKGIDGERTRLFFDALRLVRDLRPRWCAFENSPRLRTRGVDRLLGELEEAAYAFWPLVVGTSDLGANHIRKRLVLIAADTEQVSIRLEPWRLSGANGQGASLSLVHDEVPHADGQGQHAGARDAEAMAWRQEHDGDAADAAGIDIQQPRIPQGTIESDGAGQAWPRFRLNGGGRSAPDTNHAGRAIGHPHWSASAPDFGRVDDGLSDKVARACIAAYGDAFCPQVAELVGRAILHVDSLRRAA